MKSTNRNMPPLSFMSGSGAIGGLVAFLGASCCLAPIILIELGVASGLAAKLGWFERWQAYFFWTSAILLAFALLLALWRGQPSRAFWLLWGIGAVFLAASYALPHYEFQLQSWLLDWVSRLR